MDALEQIEELRIEEYRVRGIIVNSESSENEEPQIPYDPNMEPLLWDNFIIGLGYSWIGYSSQVTEYEKFNNPLKALNDLLYRNITAYDYVMEWVLKEEKYDKIKYYFTLSEYLRLQLVQYILLFEVADKLEQE
jgi:hypothetical protein